MRGRVQLRKMRSRRRRESQGCRLARCETWLRRIVRETADSQASSGWVT